MSEEVEQSEETQQKKEPIMRWVLRWWAMFSMRPLLDKMGGRKWTLTLMVLWVGILMAFFGNLSDQAVNLLVGLVAAYNVGNAGSRFVGRPGVQLIAQDVPSITDEEEGER